MKLTHCYQEANRATDALANLAMAIDCPLNLLDALSTIPIFPTLFEDVIGVMLLDNVY